MTIAVMRCRKCDKPLSEHSDWRACMAREEAGSIGWPAPIDAACDGMARFDDVEQAAYVAAQCVAEFDTEWVVQRHNDHFHVREVVQMPAPEFTVPYPEPNGG